MFKNMSDNGTKKSQKLLWAENEIELACKMEKESCQDQDYDMLSEYSAMCYDSALKMLMTLIDCDPSGYAVVIIKDILNRLIDGLPLTPIDDTEDIWTKTSDNPAKDSGISTYVCKRLSSLFKNVNSETGEITYTDAGRAVGVDEMSGVYRSSLTTSICDDMFPIVMPYMPSSQKFKVYTEEFLYDQDNGGDLDTEGILYIETPTGERVEVNRFFVEPSHGCESSYHGWIEITKDEYDKRKAVYEKRNEENNINMEGDDNQ